MAIAEVNLGTIPKGEGGDTPRSAMIKINSNFTNTAHAASRLVGTENGNVLEVGAFGLGGGVVDVTTPSKYLKTGFYAVTPKNQEDFPEQYGIFTKLEGLGWSFRLFFAVNGNAYLSKSINKTTWDDFKQFLILDQNVSKDPNGFIKAASPIVSLYADKIELNDEAKLQPITFEKLGVGDYLIKGSTGFAQEGWYIEVPKDANGNVLVAVVYKQLPNNDISVKTYAKKFDEETGDIVPNTDKPRDIPETRWVDLRLESISK